MYVLWLGTHCNDLVTRASDYIFYIMTSQRDKIMHIRRRPTLEYVKRIYATRYIAPCICHTIRHVHGNDVLPSREVYFFRRISSNVRYSGRLSVPHHVQDLQSCHKMNASVCDFNAAHRRPTVQCDVLISLTTNIQQNQNYGFPAFINYGNIYLRRLH